VASNVLADRLSRLVAEGIVERVRYSERPERFEYHLTGKGRELGLALLALMQWGDRHISEAPARGTSAQRPSAGFGPDRRKGRDRCGTGRPGARSRAGRPAIRVRRGLTTRA
jgi:DNA-binding PadR family transcriptional regulator